jgi:PAS domain S-box-containing protein
VKSPAPALEPLVLIIDDDALLCQMLRDQLTEVGFRVDIARDGQAGLQRLAENVPDIVLVDLVMPVMDGIAFCQAVRADAHFQDLPLVMLTARAEFEQTVNPFQVGADDYLSKPVDPVELAIRLRSIIAKRAATRQLADDARNSRVLLDITRSVTSTLDTREILRQIVERVATTLQGVFRCSIIYIRSDDHIGHVVASSDDPGLPTLRLALDDYPEILQAIATGKPVLVEDVRTDPLLKLVRKRLDGSQFNTIIVLPVIFESVTIGVMVVRALRAQARVSEHELQFCELVASVSANSLQHAQVVEAANHEAEVLRQSRALLEQELGVKAIYELMFEGASEGLAALDEDQRILFVNTRAQEITGFTRRELQRMQFTELLEEASAELFLSTVRPEKISAMLPRRRLDVQLACGDGVRRLVSVSIGDRPRVTGLQVISFRDVTERRQIEETLLQTQADLTEANARLLELDRTRTEFYNTAAHELRTPVAIVNGYCELLDMCGRDQLTPQQHEYLEQAIQGCDRLVRLVNDMLDLSRFESGHMDLHCSETDLADLIRDVCRETRALADRKGVVLDASSGPMCPVEIDVPLIRRLLINLVGNAIKFTPSGGRVTISLADQGTDVKVCVLDNGCGIDPDEIPHLFREFYRSSNPFNQEGSGLGLTISKKIVDAHSGLMHVKSAPGEGSRFSFVLPRRQS